MTGPVAGRYQLHARIGQGATGVVYEATDPDHGRQVAVKMMLPDVAQDVATRQHFLRDARAVSQLRHRHLATVYDVAGADDPPFVAMERLRGRTLAERQTVSPPLTLAEALEIVEQLCLGLQFAHEHGLVHRHVTPANIWLLEDGSVKLVDFGLPAASAPTVTDSRRLVGRVAYLAPEQIAAKTVDGRADIFAVGVVLFELVTGRRPFEAESVTGVFDKVVNQPADPVLSLVPAEAARVDEVLRRALAKDPAQRYQDALEMAADLTLTRIELVGSSKVLERAPEPVMASAVPVPQPRDLGFSGAGVPGPQERVADPQDRAAAPQEAPAPERFADLPEAPQDELELYTSDTWQSSGPTGYAAPAPTLFDRFRTAAETQNPIVLVTGGATIALAVIIVAWFAWRTPTPRPQTRSASASRTTPSPPTAAPPAAASGLRIETDPSDAEVFVNGESLGVRTPATVPADRLRNAELRLVKPGYDPLTARLTPADLAKPAMSFPLVTEAQPIVVSGSAPFEFEVVSGRTVVSRSNTSHRFTIRGPQTLRVRAPVYYLDRAVSIPAGQSAVTLSVPALGRLSVRTSPSLERCRVSIGGREFGTPPYPPVPYQSIVAGVHRVELTCPDGSVRDQGVTVEAARDRAAVFR